MDENTKIIVEGLNAITKQNTEINRQLKELNKTTTLKESIEDNRGEILTTIAVGAAESATDRAIAKGHNLGIGVTAKAGVDIIPGGEPSVDEKQTLFGITKEFYAKHTVQSLIDSLGQVNETLIKQSGTEKEVILLGYAQKTIMDKLFQFFRSDSGDGFFGGLADKFGVTKLRHGISKFFNAKERKELFNKFGQIVGTKLKLGLLSVVEGIKNLGKALLKPLGNIVKGILGLPKKILGFFGGVLDIIGRLALLGGGLFALSKLTEFLRGVGPEGRKSFTQFLMKAFEITEAVLVGLKDILLKVVIPALGLLASTIFGIVKFLAQKGFLPGIKLGSGVAAREEKKIREQFKDRGMLELIVFDEKLKRPRAMNDEEYEAFIQEKLKEAKDKRRKEFFRGKRESYKQYNTGMPEGFYPFTLEEIEERYRDEFNLMESDDFFIMGQPIGNITGEYGKIIDRTNKRIEKGENLKNNQGQLDTSSISAIEPVHSHTGSINNAGVSVAQVDNSSTITNDREFASIFGNPINQHV